MQCPNNSTRVSTGAMAGALPIRARLPVSPSACRGGRLGVFIPSRLAGAPSKRAVAGAPPSPRQAGMTLLEMVIAMAIVVVILTAILPAFRSIRNSWDAKQAAAETLQNSRVLMDHLNYNLSKAVRITDVSDSTETSGYIQFEDNDGNDWRYEIDDSNLVEFGLVGSLSDLAGPVSQLQFTCYDACDLDIPLDISTVDFNDIRFVDVNATLTNSATLGHDEFFTASIYLRTGQGSSGSGCPNLVGWWKLDETSGTIAEDSSDNDNNGVLVHMNPVTDWVTGQIDGALDFDGNNDYVAIQNLYYDVSGYAEVSVTAWIRTSNGGNQIIASYDRNEYWRLEIKGSGAGTGRVGWDVRTSTGQVDYGSITRVDDGMWHHVAGVFDNGTLTIYIDGEPEPSASGGSTFGRGVNTRYGFLGVGSEATTFNGNKGPTNYFNGDMDDVRIYNIALDNDEIKQLLGVVIYKEFDETKVSSDANSITISTPDTNQGDLLIAAVATDGDTSSSLAPPGGEGWTEIDIDDCSNAVTLGAWWKLAGASEPNHTFTWSGAEQAYGWMMRFIGHDSTNPIDACSVNCDSDVAPTSPAVTTTVDNCLILRLGAFDDDDVSTLPEPGNPGLSGHTAITMDKSASGSAGQVTYEGFNEGRQTSSAWWATSVTVPIPSGTSQGDLLVAAVVTDGRTDTSLAPPVGKGWNPIRIDRRGNAVTLGVWWKLADASESPTHQFTWSGGEEAYGWIMRFTGHDATAPIWDRRGGNSNSPICNSVTTTVANTMIVRIGGFDDDDVSIGNTGLSGHTDITMDESSSTGDTCSGGAGYVQQAAIGASGIANFSLTAGEQWRTLTIAIAPAVSGDTVSGGAGCVKQSSASSSGISNFSLGPPPNEAQMITIAIAPNSDSGCTGSGGIQP